MNTFDTGKRGEYLVLGELLKRGARVYVPVVDVEGIDAVVRRKDGTYIELQVKTVLTDKSPRWFYVQNLEARENYFIVCVALATVPPETWIIPSTAFQEHATRSTKTNWYDLNLDSTRRGFAVPRHKLLEEYLDAWHLLTGEQRVDLFYMASEESFAEDWDSPEDSVYDRM